MILILGSNVVNAQKVENVRFEQVGKQIIIYYDLTGTRSGQTYDVQVFCSTDGGLTFGNPLKQTVGDIGRNITGGPGKKIIWEVLGEQDKLTGEVVFEIWIRNNIKSGSVANSKNKLERNAEVTKIDKAFGNIGIIASLGISYKKGSLGFYEKNKLLETSLAAGVFYDIRVNKKFSIQPAFIIIPFQHFPDSIYTYPGNTYYHYNEYLNFNVPLNLKYKIGSDYFNFFLMAGPIFSFSIIPPIPGKIVNYFINFSSGVSFGKIQLMLNYNLGLNDIYRYRYLFYRMDYLLFSLGYQFGK